MELVSNQLVQNFIAFMRLKHFNLSFGSQLFKSFSDESRIRILHLLLMNKEMCIADLELVLDFTQTKISRHLGYLKNAGVVGYQKADQWAYYYIKEEVLDIITQLFQYLSKDTALLHDLETYRVLYSNRELAIYKRHRQLRRRIS
jgi:ArsR family transcriptional regulator, arsenate/arsenite/antimonite-responsive transcriptional repressor